MMSRLKNSFGNSPEFILENGAQRNSSAIYYFIFISIACFFACLSSGTFLVVYFFLFLFSFLGGFRAIQAITLSWLFTMLNPALVGDGIWDAMRWLVIIFAFVWVLFYWASKLNLEKSNSFYVPFFLFSSWAILASLFSSYALDVSIFKVVMFFVGVITLLTLMGSQKNNSLLVENWFLALFYFVILLSVPLYFTNIGYLRNENVFQGALNHPQAFAIFLAISFVWFFSKYFFDCEKKYFYFICIFISGFFLIQTLARTAVLAVVSSLFIVGIIRLKNKRDRRKWLIIISFLLSTFLFGFFFVSGFNDFVFGFVFKGGVDDNISDAFESSRGFLISRSYDNFLGSPITGIGFGVASDPARFSVTREPIFDLPIGAPVEKGFAIVAILEEVGVIGAALFLWFVYSLIKPLVRYVSPTPLALALTALFVNFGESIILSVSGMGLFIWLVISFVAMAKK